MMDSVRGSAEEESTCSSSLYCEGKSTTAIPETNIGFKLLQKSGWRVGSGLGADEQGRLNPLETHAKFDKRGIGADKPIRKRNAAMGQGEKVLKQETNSLKQKVKPVSKKARKAKMEAERLQEQAFQRDFFREFWPENV